MSYQHLGTLLTISIALYLPLVACGEDNDILRKDLAAPVPAEQGDTSPADTADPTQNQDAEDDGDLSDAEHLTSSEGACEASACPTPPSGTSCCTTADDVTANLAVVAGHCGIDMAAFGFPGCTQRDQPGVLDDACPPVEFPPGAPPMPGCCTAAGHCGAMETFMGFGCNSNPDSSTWVDCGG